MRIGARVGPVWVSTGGSRRRRRRKQPSAKQGTFIIWLIGVAYLLVSGGWWVVLGWSVVGVTLIGLLVRAVKRTPGSQHHAGTKALADAASGVPASERMYHSNRR